MRYQSRRRNAQAAVRRSTASRGRTSARSTSAVVRPVQLPYFLHPDTHASASAFRGSRTGPATRRSAKGGVYIGPYGLGKRSGNGLSQYRAEFQSSNGKCTSIPAPWGRSPFGRAPGWPRSWMSGTRAVLRPGTTSGGGGSRSSVGGTGR
jgi:hypothetical protein